MRRDQLQRVRKCIYNEEPVFVLRARDICSITTLERYFDAAKKEGCPQEFLDDMLEVISEFKDFQRNNPTRLPD